MVVVLNGYRILLQSMLICYDPLQGGLRLYRRS